MSPKLTCTAHGAVLATLPSEHPQLKLYQVNRLSIRIDRPLLNYHASALSVRADLAGADLEIHGSLVAWVCIRVGHGCMQDVE
jgi:hypothetical protein